MDFQITSGQMVILGFAVLVVFLLAIIIIMCCGLKSRIDHVIRNVNNNNEDILNLTQASKRVERMCDAINQRTRSYSIQIKTMKLKDVGNKSVAGKNKLNNKKETRKYDQSKKKRGDSPFTVRDYSKQ